MQKKNYRLCFREPDGLLTHPFIVPGSGYTNSLWDWDSWLTDLALRRIAASGEMERYEKGCILNFLDHMDAAGRIPICILPKMTAFEEYPGQKNIHKPCLAQHALFIAEQSGDAEWLREQYGKLETFVGWYARNCRHESGLYFWLDDFAIGVDNDPCTFYRPDGSSASIYLNCLMYRELLAMAELGARLGLEGKADCYRAEAEALKGAIQTCCWDERDGMFYNVDINLLPVDRTKKLHSSCPRHWSTLIQRIDVWSCFLPMWAGLATPEQAERNGACDGGTAAADSNRGLSDSVPHRLSERRGRTAEIGRPEADPAGRHRNRPPVRHRTEAEAVSVGQRERHNRSGTHGKSADADADRRRRYRVK